MTYKSSWDAFKTGFIEGSKYGLMMILGAILYILLTVHPYDHCEEQYDTPEDIIECVWILKNEG